MNLRGIFVNRPMSTLVLAGVAALSALSNFVVTLHFLGVIDWGDDDPDFWGGKWAGVFMFGLATAIALFACYGWITLQPWVMMITVLMAFLGFANPFSAWVAGTETMSTAIGPIIVNL